MHPIDLFTNVILCVLYLCICLIVSMTRACTNNKTCSRDSVILRTALVLSMVPTLAHPAVASQIGGWTGALLFSLPLVPFICALRLKNPSDKIAFTVVTSMAALYFMECSRLTVLATLFPPPLFS